MLWKTKKSSKKKKTDKLSTSRKNKFSLKKLFKLYKLIIGIIFIIISIILYSLGYHNNLIKSIKNQYFNVTAKFGLTLENVYLEGQNHTDTETLMNVMQLKIGQSLLSVPIDELKVRLEKISWIKHAVIKRDFPNTLYIGIVERKPIALWQHLGSFFLIDETGAIIKDNNLKKFSKFIVLIGEDAPLNAQYLMEFLTKEKTLFDQVTYAIRIGERRWNIRFQNGLEIKLPEDNPELAWQYIIDLFNKKNLFGKAISCIDLRISKKLYIK